MWHIMIDTLADSVQMIPFLFLAYFMIEYMENKASDGLKKILMGSGKYGPIGGSFLGSFPQCGFSVAAANLYAERFITKGTLLAVFLATSDEAIPIFLANQSSGRIIFSLLAIKIMIALIFGFLVDFVDTRCFKNDATIATAPQSQLCKSCNCKENILLAAIKHTMTIFLFILVVSFILNSVIYLLGEVRLSKLLMTNTPFQPMIAGLFGLIPNCAASVVLTQLYLSGSISLGSTVAGLSTGAGIGLAVLFRTNSNQRENLKILALLYFIGAACGMIIQYLGIVL
ncbi:MAG: putative manganese transporter [Anaerovorax sp.]